MASPDIISYGYALIVFAGGCIGYMKAGMQGLLGGACWCAIYQVFIRLLLGSLMSMGSGIAFGTVLGYGAYRMSIDPKDVMLSLGKYKYYVTSYS